MRTVRLGKHVLLDTLRANREKHVEEFREIDKAYREEAAEKLLGQWTLCRNGEGFTTIIHLQKPISHAQDYDHAIKMLEMSVDDVVELTQDEFRSLVMDEWDWKAQFSQTASLYGAFK